MVNIDDVSEIKRDLEILLIEEDKEIESIQCIMKKAERAGAINTAKMMRALLDHEMREKEGLNKLVNLYASEEQRLLTASCPTVGDLAGINAMVGDFSGINAVYEGYSGVRSARGRY